MKAHPFSNIEAEADVGPWIKTLDRVRAHPFYRAYKQRVAELLALESGDIAVEVGCGTGADALAASELGARIVGLDFSPRLLDEASKRGLPWVVAGDAHHLPLATGSVEAYWADRALQHIENPRLALSEAARVVRPGGRIVVVDPDYSTQELAFPDPTLAQSVLEFRERYAIRHGALGQRIAELFPSEVADLRLEPRRLVVRDPGELDGCLGMRSWIAGAEEMGLVGPGDVERWYRLYDEVASSGAFRWAVTFVIASAQKT